MNAQLATVLALLAVCVALFIGNRPRMDVVSLAAMAVLPLAGIISVPEALAGFSDQNVILIALLFVVGEGLVRTGIANGIGDLLLRHSSGSETRLIILLMVAVAAVGSVMSSTGVVALFIPITLLISNRRNISPGRLMMPLAYAGLISGMLTLVGTAPNLVMDAALRHAGHQGLGFFSLTPFGAVILLAGIVYMLCNRHRLARLPAEAPLRHRRRMLDLVREYKLEHKAHLLRVSEDSPLIGQTLAEFAPRRRFGMNVVAIERRKRRRAELLEPRPDLIIEAGDLLLGDIETPSGAARSAAAMKLEPLSLGDLYFIDRSKEIGMAEFLVPPSSSLLDQTVAGAAIRTRFRLNVIGLRRGGDAIELPAHGKLRIGDTLLMIGRWKHIRTLGRRVGDVVLLTLPAEVDGAPPAASRAPFAAAALALMVALMVTGLMPNVFAALLACLFMGAAGCLTLEAAYRSIHWPSLILIIGMMPFSVALQKTGGVELAVGALMEIFGASEPRVLLGALFAITAVTGLFISNTATAVLMAPIALRMAETLGVSPYPFSVTVALAASSAFMTPVSSPVNTLVMGPGGYRFADYLRIGIPFTLIAMVLILALVPWLLPF